MGTLAVWVRGALRAALVALALVPDAAVSAAPSCSRSIADIYETDSPGVVLITALTINPYRIEDRVQEATGSGFIIDDRGLIMTNSHVVFGAQVLTVTLDDGSVHPAKVLGADPIYDLAVLQFSVPKGSKLPVLGYGDSDLVKPGDKVVVIGNPLGLEQTVTSGIVSGLNRFLGERPRLLSWPMIQTDAAINPGNSGGPLLDRCGKVIGVTTEIIGGAQNVAFAIPSELARSVLTQLVEKGHVVRPWFGVDGSLIGSRLRQVLSVPLTDGFLVEAVEPGSPADAAGIRGGSLPIKIGARSLILGGDIIVSINGVEIKDEESLQRGLKALQIGARVRMKLFREGKIFETELKIIERPLQPGDVPESSQIFSVEKNGVDGGK